jgi:cytoskeleton protein RodZ
VTEKLVQTLGSYLREVRESRGINLDEAADVTRISKNYLIAIEEERFDKLPGPVYVKGFLRVYAGFLGLSGDETVARYTESLASQQSAPSAESTEVETTPEGRSLFSRPLLWLTPLLAAILLWFFFNPGQEKGMDKSTEAPDLKQNSAVPVMPRRSSAVDGVTTKRDLTKGGQGESAAPTPPLKRSGIILKLKVNQDCWLNITIDDAASQQYDLKAGDLIEWKGEKTFALDIGNAGGIEAEFNGKPLESFGGPGKTAHVLLKDEGA